MIRRPSNRRTGLSLVLGSALVLGARAASAQTAPADFDPAKELLRIAKMKQDDRLLASFAEARGRTAPNLTEKEIFVIVDTVERVGSPDRAIKMLQDRVKKYPQDLVSRVSLAKMFVRASQAKNAIPVWRDIALKLGLTPAHAIEYAEVLSLTGDHAAGLSVLASLKDKAPPDAVDYWKTLAQASWDQDDTATALVAYKKIWSSEPPVPLASSRLMQLLSSAGMIDEAIVVAKQALVREKNPAHLLFVARLQIKGHDYAGAKRTLDLADDQRALVASTLEYWMLRAEVATQVGDKDGARAAYRVAHGLDPSAPGVRAALLWDSIDRNDLRRLATDLKDWAPDAANDKELWAPTAVGLDHIGRTHDAIKFYVLQSKDTPNDNLWTIEVADALARVGEEGVAQRLRRRAFTGIRASALAAFKVASDQRDQKLLQTHAFLTQQLRGAPEAEKWLERMLVSDKPSLELEEFAVAWYLQEDRADKARRHLARAHVMKMQRATTRRYALLLAMADDDRVEIERLLEAPNDLSEGEKAAAYLRIERDDKAAQPLMAVLDHADVTAATQGATPTQLAADADAPTLRRELRGIQERTAPTLTGGGAFVYVNDLATYGVVAAGSHIVGSSTRLVYTAGARQFDDQGTASVRIRPGRTEADAEVLARVIGARRVTELRLGGDYQTDVPSALMPRAGYVEVLQLSKKVTLGFEVGFQSRIEDTSFLRLAGLRDVITADMTWEPVRRLYFIGSILLQEDHTRSFDYLGAEAGGSVEGGVKILEKVPVLTVGGRVGAYGRDNVRFSTPGQLVPLGYANIVKPNESRSALYPPSFQSAAIHVRISRGDFFERSRPELIPFPRYDCELEGGALLAISVAPPAAAFAARCAVSVRMPTNGYLSVTSEYIKGVAGIAQADNAHAGLTFTQFLR